MEVLDRRGRPRVQTVFEDESLTVQSDASRADIRHILGKYKEFGVQSAMAHVGQFVDLSELTDYADAMRVVRATEEAFKQLPSQARKVFKNDASAWLDAVQDADVDPVKMDLLVQAGLLEAPPAPPEAPAAPPAPRAE